MKEPLYTLLEILSFLFYFYIWLSKIQNAIGKIPISKYMISISSVRLPNLFLGTSIDKCHFPKKINLINIIANSLFHTESKIKWNFMVPLQYSGPLLLWVINAFSFLVYTLHCYNKAICLVDLSYKSQ